MSIPADKPKDHVEKPAERSYEKVLPIKLLSKVFSYLSPADLQSTQLTSKHWYAATKATLEANHKKPILHATRYLVHHIDHEKYPEQATKLTKILEEKEIVTGVRLSALKGDWMSSIAEIIKDVHSEDLSLFTDPPSDIKKILELVTIYKELEEAAHAPEARKKEILLKCLPQLIVSSHLEKALDIAKNLNQFDRVTIEADIAIAYAKKGSIETCFVLLDPLPESQVKAHAFCEVSKELAKQGKIELAKEIANSIRYTFEKSQALNFIRKLEDQ